MDRPGPPRPLETNHNERAEVVAVSARRQETWCEAAGTGNLTCRPDPSPSLTNACTERRPAEHRSQHHRISCLHRSHCPHRSPRRLRNNTLLLPDIHQARPPRRLAPGHLAALRRRAHRPRRKRFLRLLLCPRIPLESAILARHTRRRQERGSQRRHVTGRREVQVQVA